MTTPVLTILIGLVLGLGLLLVCSPALWPTDRISVLGIRPRFFTRMEELMTLAGFRSPSAVSLIAVSIIGGLAIGALVLAIVPVLALAAAAGLVTVVAPSAIVGWRASGRRKSNRVLWPDLVDHLVSAVRSGLPLPDSVVALAYNGPEPTRAAFATFERDYRATANFSSCLDRVKQELADPVADRILETLRMSREVGGTELTTVLRNLSVYLRQEAAIRSEVEARQSWVVNAARLGVASPWVILFLLASRPEAAAAYNSPSGTALIATGFALTVVAYRIMLALGRLPEERRWFQ